MSPFYCCQFIYKLLKVIWRATIKTYYSKRLNYDSAFYPSNDLLDSKSYFARRLM